MFQFLSLSLDRSKQKVDSETFSSQSQFEICCMDSHTQENYFIIPAHFPHFVFLSHPELGEKGENPKEMVNTIETIKSLAWWREMYTFDCSTWSFFISMYTFICISWHLPQVLLMKKEWYYSIRYTSTTPVVWKENIFIHLPGGTHGNNPLQFIFIVK